jgi:hypothetical protein
VVLAWEHPVRHQIACACTARRYSGAEEGRPWVAAVEEGNSVVLGSKVLPDGVALVAMDAAFALLQVDRIARQVPVNVTPARPSSNRA